MKNLKSKIKFIGAFLALAVMCMPTMMVQAKENTAETSKTYTVTFRPGNVGAFAHADAVGDKKANAEAVAAEIYGAYSYEVTKNGAIKVTVSEGEPMPVAPNRIQAESGYFVKDTSIWGPGQDAQVEKNVDFVVDYGKLVNGVEYTVEYVDSSSGESIAPVYIAQANVGETRTVTAPRQIVISEGTVYNLSSKVTLEKVLDADATKNVFTFSYTMAPRGTVEEEIVTYIETETYVDEGTTVITMTEDGDAAEGEGGNAEGEGDDSATGTDNEGEAAGDNVTIGDEDSPLNAGELEDENKGNAIDISEGKTPLANMNFGQGANAAVIWSGIFALAAVGITLIWIFIRKKRAKEESGNK